MITITELVQTCEAVPSQWEGKTRDGDYVYIRYRWGGLVICVAKSEEQMWVKGGNSKTVFAEQVGGEWDGEMSLEKLIETTKSAVKFDLKEPVRFEPPAVHFKPNAKPL